MSIRTAVSIIVFVLVELGLKPTHTCATHALVVPAITVAQVSKTSEEFKQAILEPVKRAGLSIRADGEKGIEQLMSEYANQNHFSQQKAMRDAERLGDMIVEVANKRGTRYVTASIARTAAKSICPLWPYC